MSAANGGSGTLQVQVAPANPGDVTINVKMSQYPPTSTPIDQTFVANTGSPLDQTFQLAPGLYAVTISWGNGYQNIASGGGPGNNIFVNGISMYYQVLGTPAANQSISAMFGVQV